MPEDSEMSCYKFAYKKKIGPINAYTITQSSIAASITDVIELECNDQYKLKSGTDISVLCVLPYRLVQCFFKYNENELLRLPKDIRGLSSYRTSDIIEGKLECQKFHKIGTVIIFVLKGAIKLTCKDIEGSVSTTILKSNKGIFIPPYILYSYLAVENTDLLFFTNTISNTEDPKTNDTYANLSNVCIVN